jgi:Na+/H+ antiporter NhaD/arsenite permease-like protein
VAASAVAAVAPGSSVRAWIAEFFKRETVLVIAWGLALVSMFFIPPSTAYVGYMDFKVLGCLFALMLVVAGFSRINLFNQLAYQMLVRVRSPMQVSAVLVGITFFSSMWITNDVALITFVPFTLVVFGLSGNQKPILLTIVLQTVAANIGSSLTPVGNPQNLYIYSYYHMAGGEFFAIMLPLVLAGVVLLFLLLLFLHSPDNVFSLQLKPPEVIVPLHLVRYLVLFTIALLAVFDIVPWYLAVLMVALGAQWRLIKEVDYSLLLTFVGFFIFVGNMGELAAVRQFLERLLVGRVFLTSLLASEIISNVPATLLLSHFTDDARQLLLGVNAGGCGTLIASLASVISFKLYAKFNPQGTGRYLGVFTLVNFAFVVLFIIVWLFL